MHTDIADFYLQVLEHSAGERGLRRNHEPNKSVGQRVAAGTGVLGQ